MRNNPMDLDGPSGVLLIDKAEDMTSHDVVAIARRDRDEINGRHGVAVGWKIRRVGHDGCVARNRWRVVTPSEEAEGSSRVADTTISSHRSNARSSAQTHSGSLASNGASRSAKRACASAGKLGPNPRRRNWSASFSRQRARVGPIDPTRMSNRCEMSA